MSSEFDVGGQLDKRNEGDDSKTRGMRIIEYNDKVGRKEISGSEEVVVDDGSRSLPTRSNGTNQ